MPETQQLSLYKMDGCPYCQRVAGAIRDLELDIEVRDIRKITVNAVGTKECDSPQTPKVQSLRRKGLGRIQNGLKRSVGARQLQCAAPLERAG